MTDAQIDKLLTDGQSQEVLLRLATVDRAIELYKDRTLVSVDDFCESVDKIYKLLKDGRLPEKRISEVEKQRIEQRIKIEQGVR